MEPAKAAGHLMSLAALQRQDPYINKLLDVTSQVALYNFNSKANEWEKTEIEGTLFVYSRSASPQHGFTIMNRLSTENLVEPINKDLEFQLQDPFLLYRNANLGIYSIWFYDKKDCQRIAQLMLRIVKQEADHAQRPSPERAGSGRTNGVAEPRPIDILELLSKAKEEYHRNQTGETDAATEPSGKPVVNATEFTHNATQPEKSSHTMVKQITVEELFGSSLPKDPSLPAMPTQTAAMPIQTAAMPTQTAAMPTQTAAMPTQTAAMPTQTAAMPTQTAAMPTQTAAMPTQTAAMPNQTATMPTQTAAMPNQTAAMPTQTAAMPTQTTATSVPSSPSPSTTYLQNQNPLLPPHLTAPDPGTNQRHLAPGLLPASYALHPTPMFQSDHQPRCSTSPLMMPPSGSEARAAPPGVAPSTSAPYLGPEILGTLKPAGNSDIHKPILAPNFLPSTLVPPQSFQEPMGKPLLQQGKDMDVFSQPPNLIKPAVPMNPGLAGPGAGPPGLTGPGAGPPGLTGPGAGPPGLTGAEVSVLLSPSAFKHSASKTTTAAAVVPPASSHPSSSPTGGAQPPQTPCSKTQLQHTLIHLIQSDPAFLNAIHDAYLLSVSKDFSNLKL